MTEPLAAPARRIEPARVLGEAWRIYKEQAGVLLPAAAAVYLIDALVSYALGDGAAALIAAIVSLVVSTLFQGMVVQLVRDVIDGRRDSSVGELVRSVQPVLLTLLVVSVAGGIGVGIGFIALIVPGLWLMTIWAVIAPVVVVERTQGFDAFGRSRALVRGHGWQVLAVVLLVLVLLIAAGIVAGIIASGLGDAGGAVAGWIVSVLLAPFSALATAVLYFMLRVAHGEPERPEDAVTWMPPVAPGPGYP
jgi:hypothetical protein